MKWCGKSSHQCFFQNKAFLKAGALVWLVLHLAKLQVLISVVKMLRFDVWLTGWQSEIWVNMTAGLNNNCPPFSLGIVWIGACVNEKIRTSVRIGLRTLGLFDGVELSPLCAHSLQRNHGVWASKAAKVPWISVHLQVRGCGKLQTFLLQCYNIPVFVMSFWACFYG